MVSRCSSQTGTMAASGDQNGLRPVSSQSQRPRSTAWGPIRTRAPRTVTPVRILRAIAPAATRAAVSRAGLPTAAAIVADAVLGEIGVVGVAGAEGGGDLRIVARALVDVVDDQRDRRAGGDWPPNRSRVRSSSNTPERMRTASGSWRWVTNLPCPGRRFVEPDLDVGLGERNPRRAAVDHAAQRRPMALAPGGDAEQMAEGVVRHWRRFYIPERGLPARIFRSAGVSRHLTFKTRAGETPTLRPGPLVRGTRRA